VAKVLNLVGYVQYEFGSLLAALKAMEEALEIQRNCSGCDEDAADTLSNMGFMYAKTNDYPEAVAVLREALGLQRRVLSDAHPRTIVTRDNLNYVLALQNGSVAFHVSVVCLCQFLDVTAQCRCLTLAFPFRVQSVHPCIDSTVDMNCHPLSSFTPQWNDD